MPIWKTSILIAEQIFYLTDLLPHKEDYGFTSQIRRSALSISANIAEAFGRNHIKDKIKFYFIARGSLTETQSHLEYGLRIGYISQDKISEIDNVLLELHEALNKVIKSIKSNEQ